MSGPAESAPTSDGFARAYARVRADHSLQFEFHAPPVVHRPWWATMLARLLEWMWPFLKVAIWLGLAALAIAVLVLLVRAGLRSRRKPATKTPFGAKLQPESWRPTATQARALLQDADRLAEQARFSEAVHLLLLRSVEDIQGRRPGLVRPALTSRDIAGLDGLPPAARSAFEALAQMVERSLFGGSPLDAEAFAAGRGLYESFAFPQSWVSAGPARA